MQGKIKGTWRNLIFLVFPIMYFILAALSFNGITAKMEFLTISSVVVLVFGALAFLNVLPDIIKNYKNYPAILLCAAFVVSYMISSVFHGTNGITENLKAICWLVMTMLCLYPTGIYSIALEKKNKVSYAKIICCIIMAYAGLAALAALVILFGNMGHFWKPGIVYGFYEGRLYGLFTDPNYGSSLSAAAFAMSLFCFLQGNKKRVSTWLFAVNAAVLYLYIAFTFSRTGELILIFAIVTIFAYWLISRKYKLLKSILLILICIALCLGISGTRKAYNFVIEKQNEQAIKEHEHSDAPAPVIKEEVERTSEVAADFEKIRLQIWLDAIDVIKKEPVFGVSYRNILNYLKESLPDAYMINREYDLDTFHNSILDVTASQGLVGLGILLAIVVVLFVRLFGRYKYLERADRDGVVFALIPVLVIMGASMMISDIFYINSPSTVTFWYLLGQVMGRLNNKKEEI